MALSMFGVDHILFGTDIPFREDIDLQLKDLDDLALSAEERRKIESGNAARLLNL
jgi:predicted TIM-barrel fold metal-dependent hydrolase